MAQSIFLSVLVTVSLCGCGALPSGRGWGEDATLTPGWDRFRESTVQAARDPWVWAPLVGAALFQVDDLDQRVSDWARERTPVFGSQRSAEDWSDHLRDASAVAHYATVFATPSGDAPREWVINKARGVAVGVGAVSSTVLITNALKSAVDRERPNGLALESFPSGHTSSSAVHTRLGSRNLHAIDMSASARRVANVGLYALTIGTSWARIEAGWHYPTDTLFSIALGNFIGSVANDAFMGDAPQHSIALTLHGDAPVMTWQVQF